MWKIWNSRIRLVCISAFLLVLNISLHKFENNLKTSANGNRKTNINYHNDEKWFNSAVDYALEAMLYMHNYETGKAEIRPLIEQEKKVREYWWKCYLEMPAYFEAGDWLKNDDLFVYSSTYDRRNNSLYPNNHIVQVLAMSFRSFQSEHGIFCNLYDINRNRYTVVEGTVREIWQRAWDPRDFFYIPNLISCPVPEDFKHSTNLLVSLSKTPCKSQKIASYVRMPLLKQKKNAVAVCVKGLDYLEDIPERLIEWIEMQFLVGADSITLYTYYVPNKMQQVLNYYSKFGSVEVIPISLPGDSPNQVFIRSRFIWRNRQQKRRHELIAYNDCFYRYIDTHKFVLIIDIDEVVIPLKHNNWTGMLNYLTASFKKSTGTIDEITSISTRNVFKFPSNIDLSSTHIPPYLYMLRNRRRSETVSKPDEYGKAFINTDTVVTVFNHFALHRSHGNVAMTYYADPNIVLKLHYKSMCPIESKSDCEKLTKVTIDDTTMDRFADQLIERVTDVLSNLHIIS
ncbi:unnamed protein product [Thelazia callipaeda]|uniref:Glycosyltransferase family 92 protein n=1 Tax=Thelazia callipaeda TaxID=103827 RepID=A0A0N5CUU4_THECL|nr:unnamed protein product [Thelazia callipaeda]